MPFARALEQFCTKPVDRNLFAYLDEFQMYDRARLKEGRRQVEKRLAEVEEFQTISQETVDLVKEMLTLLDDQRALNQKMIRLDELRTLVKHRPQTYRLVMYVSQNAEIYRFREDRKINIDSVEGKERQRRQLQRDIGYVSEIVKGCQRLTDMLRDCLERFEQAGAKDTVEANAGLKE